MPCYNYARYLGECLDSIFGQVDPPPFEIIAVDDASTDDTVAMLERVRDPRLRVFCNERNLGHAGTINRALPLTRGAIVSRIDPDDRYRPQFMATVVDRLRRYPEVGLVYGRAELIDGAGAPSGTITNEPHDSEFHGSEFLALLRKNFICAPTVAARRELWLAQLPVPDTLAFHDWYFTLLIARSSEFYFVDDVLADYRVHGANHHTAISRTGAEERSVLWLLDKVFTEPEPDAARQRAKQESARSVYAAHYLDFADKYFGFGMNADARRCYWAAVSHQPGLAMRPDVMRRLGATIFGRDRYERLKAGWRRVAS
jgi:glycosyltransferase involved in cell wall biosynthesis